MTNQVIIECPDCESKVSAIVLAERVYNPNYDYPSVVYFLECPLCHMTMVGHSEFVMLDTNTGDYAPPTRLWPKPQEPLDWSIPRLVQKSIEEARKCYNAKAYAASAVMCGRSLEAICKEQNVKNMPLSKGLKELRDQGIIDGRLFDWGEALRDRRNIGAHATEEDISREDARDILDFTIAICEYVYVLTNKYEEFKNRERKRKSYRKKSKPLK